MASGAEGHLVTKVGSSHRNLDRPNICMRHAWRRPRSRSRSRERNVRSSDSRCRSIRSASARTKSSQHGADEGGAESWSERSDRGRSQARSAGEDWHDKGQQPRRTFAAGRGNEGQREDREMMKGTEWKSDLMRPHDDGLYAGSGAWDYSFEGTRRRYEQPMRTSELGCSIQSRVPCNFNPIETNRKLIGMKREEDIVVLCETSGDQFNHVNVATALHRLAKLRGRQSGSSGWLIEDGQRLKAVCSMMTARAVAEAGAFDPQGIANVMWALATIGVEPSRELASAMSMRAVASAGAFKPQGIANLMWALATLGLEPSRELASAMSMRAVASAGAFKPQNIANLMWALATLSVEPSRELASAMSIQAVASAGAFKPQNIANLMWELATLGLEPSRELALAMSKRAVASAGAFNPQDIANLMWALATLGVEPSSELALSMSVRAVASAGASVNC